MLKSLIIDNIALIDHLELSFDAGLTVLTGETGSGKSIIIDSLAFVLGDRADKTLIKYGADTAEVTALFQIGNDSRIKDKLESLGFSSESEVLVTRRMSLNGKNDARINGKTVTLAMLKDICSDLVDIFGQGQHLALLNENNQLDVLDSFCDFNGVDVELQEKLLPELISINKRLDSFGGSDAERMRLLDILKYQIDEIERAELDVNEEAELIENHKRILNLEKIIAAISAATMALDAEKGAINSTSEASNALKPVCSVDGEIGDLQNRLQSCSLELEDVNSSLQDLLARYDISQDEIERVEERLELIKTIKRKYGSTIEEVLSFFDKIQKQYDEMLNATELIAELQRNKLDVLNKMYQLASLKSVERKRVAKLLAERIMRELCDLGMKNTNFVVQFQEESVTFDEYASSPCANGFDKVEFLMSANVGEPLKPLSKVISGGEMSRFMLAIKNITAQAEKIPTMIFDEIDTGISGNIARTVAEKLAAVSADQQQGYQCIVITHLPQIAAMADDNLLVHKYQDGGRTHTSVERLSASEGKVQEVARLMGGVGVNSTASAAELVEWCNGFKNASKSVKTADYNRKWRFA